jgi:hypothetical protein
MPGTHIASRAQKLLITLQNCFPNANHDDVRFLNSLYKSLRDYYGDCWNSGRDRKNVAFPISAVRRP